MTETVQAIKRSMSQTDQCIAMAQEAQSMAKQFKD